VRVCSALLTDELLAALPVPVVPVLLPVLLVIPDNAWVIVDRSVLAEELPVVLVVDVVPVVPLVPLVAPDNSCVSAVIALVAEEVLDEPVLVPVVPVPVEPVDPRACVIVCNALAVDGLAAELVVEAAEQPFPGYTVIGCCFPAPLTYDAALLSAAPLTFVLESLPVE
jgi:hypothetical protein